MSRQWDAKPTTETLIKSVLMCRGTHFGRDLNPANIVYTAYLDADALQSDEQGVCFALDRDWNSTKIYVAQDTSKRDALRNFCQLVAARDAHVLGYIKAVEAHLTPEFEPGSCCTREEWEDRTVFEKAYTIALQREKSVLARQVNTAENEFRVSLTMRNDGSGKHYTHTKLYFCYKMPFQAFLRQLQDASQLCIIPPGNNDKRPTNETDQAISTSDTGLRDLVYSTASEEGEWADNSDSASYRSAMTNSTGLGDEYTDYMSDNSAMTGDHPYRELASQKITVHKRRRVKRSVQERKVPDLRSAGDRGYTLYHGPWYYYVVSERNPPSGRIWNRLADADDYAKMLETIRLLVAVHPTDTIAARVMHSLDVEAFEENCAQVLLESFEDKPDDIPGGWDVSLDDIDDDGLGEPFVRWLSESPVSDCE